MVSRAYLILFLLLAYFSLSLSALAQTGNNCKDVASVATLGVGTPGINGTPVLLSNMLPAVGRGFSMQVIGGPPGAFGCIISGEAQQNWDLPEFGGIFYPAPPFCSESFNLDNAGNYTQTATGKLTMELGGRAAGTQFDRLAASGAVSLNGTLELSYINNFVPSIGNAFSILTSATLGGTFSTVNAPLIPGVLLTPAYANSGVTINAVSGP